MSEQNKEINSRSTFFKKVIDRAVDKAKSTQLPLRIFEVVGFSSIWVRATLNNIAKEIDNLVYLEVGLHKGSTFISSLYNNLDRLKFAYGIDNWSQFDKDGTTKELCMNNIHNVLSLPRANVRLFDQDVWTFDVSHIHHPVNMYFYDGDHDEHNQYMAFKYFNEVLDDTFIAVVDDWNWDFVRDGTWKAFRKLGYEVIHFREMYTPNKENMMFLNWWNGLFVAVIKK